MADFAPAGATFRRTRPNAVVGPIPWGHSGLLCHALSLSSSSLASYTLMRRRRATVQWRHLVNRRQAARCGEWAQHFSNASCYICRRPSGTATRQTSSKRAWFRPVGRMVWNIFVTSSTNRKYVTYRDAVRWGPSDDLGQRA